ncbi:MAG: M48 family peptidase, partial [Pyrinomonadaceae bacterium]
KKTYRILAHHDATHDTIVVSKSLDASDVPRWVVEYIVFHEMLHIKHPTVHHNGRRYNHTPAFRHDERKFPHFQAAEDWIERSVRKLKRRARKK